VKKVHHKLTGQIRAMKIVKSRDDNMGLLNNEINIVKELDHPNIIKLYEYFQERRNYYLIYEYLPGGELFDKIKKEKCMSEMQAA
jgi:calcium-dependent protein kinase